uniref:SH2 domain containing 1B n=1 Tax=Gorilla gorilla gorilla TaxID=9595 RepID=G3RE11_GORGO
MDLPYYHGRLTKQDCETLLLKEGVDGNFLLRDSESIPGVLCLCVTAEGSPKQVFPSLKELISKFEKPNQGMVVHLLKPIKRTSPSLRWRGLKLELETFVNSNSDYVDVLP